MQEKTKSNKTRAIGYILLSAFGFALMTTFVRLSGDLPFIEKSFFRNVIALIVATVVMKRRHISFRWEKGNLPLLLVRAGCGTFGLLCNFYAVDHLLLADANMLNKMSPFFAILFSFLFLKERASWVQILAVAAAFGGSLLIIKPGLSGEAFPAFIGLMGGVGAGAAYTAVRGLSGKGEAGARIVWFFSAFSTLFVLPYLIFHFEPMTIGQFLCLLAAGLAATLGQFGVTMAYANAPAREISIYDYSQIIFAALLGFFLFAQVPDYFSILGYIIICSVSVLMFLYNRNRDRRSLQNGN